MAGLKTKVLYFAFLSLLFPLTALFWNNEVAFAPPSTSTSIDAGQPNRTAAPPSCKPQNAECVPTANTQNSMNTSCMSAAAQINVVGSGLMAMQMRGGLGASSFTCPDLAVAASPGVPCPSAAFGSSSMMGMGMGMGGMGMGMGGMGMMPGMMGGMGMGMMPGMMGGMGMMPGMGGAGYGSAAPGGGGSCDMYPPGKDPTQSPAYAAKMNLLNKQICGALCQSGQAQTLFQQALCLQNQMQAVTEKAGCFQKFLGNCQGDAQKMVQQVVKDRADTQSRIENINTRLYGSANATRGSPEPGSLMDLQNQASQSITTMAAQIKEFNQASIKLKADRTAFASYKTLSTAAQTFSCFATQINAGDRCRPEDKTALAAPDYIACMYEKSLIRGTTTNGKVTQQTEILAERQSAKLKALLSQLIGMAPASATLPTDPKEIAKFASQPALVTDLKQIPPSIQNELSKFNFPGGGDAWGFVNTRLKWCQAQSVKNVKQQLSSPDTPIGAMQKSLADQTENMDAMYQQSYTPTNTLFSTITNKLKSGGGFNLGNYPKCSNMSRNPDGQADCITKAKNEMEGMLSGRTNASRTEIMIQGSIPGNDVPIKCQGLTKCIATLEQTNTFMAQRGKRQDQDHQDMVNNANNAILGVAKSYAQKVGEMSASVVSSLKTLQSNASKMMANAGPMMGGMGMGMGMGMMGGMGGMGGMGSQQLPTVRGEAPNFADDPPLKQGLIQQPSSALGFLSQYTNTPLVDGNANPLAGTMSQLGSAIGMFQNQVAMAELMENQLQMEAQQCMAYNRQMKYQNRATQTGELRDQLAQIQGANCSHVYGSQQDCRNQFQHSFNTVNSLGAGRMDPSAFNVLRGQFDNVCGPMINTAGQNSVSTNPSMCNAISTLPSKYQSVVDSYNKSSVKSLH